MNFSIIQKSQLEGALRIDAEYYKPEFLKYNKKFSESPSIGDLVEKIIHPKEIERTYSDNGIIFLLAQNVKSNYIDWNLRVRMPEVSRKLLKQNLLKDKDVLVVRSGANFGDTAFFEEAGEEVFASADVLVIRPKGIPGIYLSTFLNTKKGKGLLKRAGYGAAQPHIAPDSIRDIKIPLFPNIYRSIEELIEKSAKLAELSSSSYKLAEDLFLKETRLKNTIFEDELSCVVNYADVANANRMDAEYFQPKYELLIKKLHSRETNSLSAFVKDYSTGYTFKSENYQEQGIPLIRINNIRRGFIDLTDTAYLSEKDYLLSPEDVAKLGDIVLSMSGTIGMSAVIPSDVAKCSINQRILRFTPKDIDPDLLALVLNSIVGSFQLGRIGTGGVQTNISYNDIKNILIPVLPVQIQKQIADLVRKSHEARKKSKELLEEAKRKVEEMIEKEGKN